MIDSPGAGKSMLEAKVTMSRANHRVTYPTRFMLVAAMNPAAAAIRLSWLFLQARD